LLWLDQKQVKNKWPFLLPNFALSAKRPLDISMHQTHQREQAIFEAALELPAEQRGDHVEAACGADTELGRRVLELLAASGHTSDYLDDSPVRRAVTSGVVVPKPGDSIGRYKLLEQIGEGGCGVVYMAEQTEPVRRRVALKIIKLGMDTKSVIARFEAERQALALMDHPNIAKVFDAGSTERPLTPSLSPGGGEGARRVGEGESVVSAGRPYFVMELVRGMKITDYCDEAKLSTRARLDLFIQVCDAIQHAHQKGIIHRDIKPSNILVTVNGGAPVPKVIDFGIAKATGGQKLTNKTVFTAFEQFIGTPAYMSPEQAVLTSLDIDTRSDIYALGVLLYELLTGETPFDAKELLAIGLDEMRRTIREREPARPSARLSTLPGQELSTTAQRRGIEPPKLVSELRGDLDWIVMKALEKDRVRRYETANGLAMDIHRHLNNEPVVACPPSRLYRFQKWVRRNKLVFAAGAAVVATLVVGLGTSTWMFFQERAALRRAMAAEQAQTQLRQEAETAREKAQADEKKAEVDEKKAQTEAAKSRQVAQFLKDMLQGVGPSAALGHDTTMLREILDKTAERIGTELTNQVEVQADLLNTVGTVYWSIGQFDEAEAMYRQAPRIATNTWAGDHPVVAAALTRLSDLLRRLRKTEASRSMAEQALAMNRRLWGNAHRTVGACLNTLGLVLADEQEYAEAERILREALVLNQKVLGKQDSQVALSLSRLGEVLLKEEQLNGGPGVRFERPVAVDEVLPKDERLNEAESKLREARRIWEDVLHEEPPELPWCLYYLAEVLRAQNRVQEAETVAREAWVKRTRLMHASHFDVRKSLIQLAALLKAQGKIAEQRALYREWIQRMRTTWKINDLSTCEALFLFAECLTDSHRGPEAESRYREALASLQKVKSSDSPGVAASIEGLAEVLARQGEWKGAADCFASLVQRAPTNHVYYQGLATLLAASGDLQNYQSCCKEIVSRFGGTTNPFVSDRMAKVCSMLPSSGTDPDVVAKMAEAAAEADTTNRCFTYFQCSKGMAEYRRGHFTDAINYEDRAIAAVRRRPGHYFDDDTIWVDAYAVSAMAHLQLNRADAARASLAKANRAAAQLPKPGSGDIGVEWRGWIIAHILLDEATALIEGNPEIEPEAK
jgi:eukaryotic-like serine/threonine-protein kinase